MKPIQNLYKYTPVEGAEKILTYSSLKFSNPIEFNDPFDGTFPKVDFNDKSIIRTIQKELAKAGGSLNPSDLRAFQEELEPDLSVLRTEWENVRSLHRILSLTECNKNILMWSHYAELHKGIVFEFNLNSFSSHIHKVEYGKNYLQKELQSNIKDVIRNIKNDAPEDEKMYESFFEILKRYLYVKKKDWSYENEWRVILQNDDSRLIQKDELTTVSFESSDLISITFGINTSPQDEENITKLAYEHSPSITLKRAYMDGWDLIIKDL